MLSKNTLPFFLVIPIFIVTSFAAFADELEPPPILTVSELVTSFSAQFEQPLEWHSFEAISTGKLSNAEVFPRLIFAGQASIASKEFQDPLPWNKATIAGSSIKSYDIISTADFVEFFWEHKNFAGTGASSGTSGRAN